MTPHVIVVGAGPAGATLARALRLRGAEVTLVDAAQQPWWATYGAWRDEVVTTLGELDVHDVWRRTWSTTRVFGRREHLIDREYGAFDNERLRSAMLTGVHCVEGRVSGIRQESRRGVVACDDGADLIGDVVVDARGSWLVESDDDVVGRQTAYGLEVPGEELVARGLGGDVMTLMDWRPASARDSTVRPPTFLYAMPWSDDIGLIEETSLCAAPGFAHADLRQRLARRMAADLTPGSSRVEVVDIAMPAATPPRTVDVLRFGAAAGLVHPVTGYSVTAALRLAPTLADAIVRLHGAGARPPQVRDAAWAALWSPARRRTRALHRMGAAITQRFDAAEIADFFDCFFDLPTSTWAPYLRVDAAPRDVRRAMLGVFRRCPVRLRMRLMSFPGELGRALVAR